MEQCEHIFSTHSIDLTFPQGSRFSPNLSAQPLYKVGGSMQSRMEIKASQEDSQVALSQVNDAPVVLRSRL